MSFNIKIGITNDDNRKLDKKFSVLFEINAELKENTDLLNPIFLVQNLSNYKINYLYCEKIDKYYFINDIVNKRGNIQELHCNIDVLNTYKNEIKEITCTIIRQENIYNSQYSDNMIPVRSERYVTAHSIGKMNDNSIILTVTN